MPLGTLWAYPRKFVRHPGLIALTDQVLVSLASVCSVFVLLIYGGRLEVGLLLWMLAPIYLLLGLQNAMVTSPYQTLIGQLELSERLHRRASAECFGISLAVVFSITALTVVMPSAMLSYGRLSVGAAVCFIVGIFGSLLREQYRSFSYSHRAISAALRSTVIYFACLATGLGVLVLMSTVTAMWVILVMGVAGIGAVLTPPLLKSLASFQINAGEVKYFLSLGRWAVFGVIFAWLLGNAYPLYIEHRFGLLEVAEVGVARLWLMPVALLVPAFVNFYRPQVFELIRTRGLDGGMRIISFVVLAIGVACMAISAVAFVLYESKYLSSFGWNVPGIAVVGAWAVYFFLFSARSMAQIFMLGSEAGYRRLSIFSLLGFLLAVFLIVFIPSEAGYTIVLSMAFVEGAMGLAVLRAVRRMLLPNGLAVGSG